MVTAADLVAGNKSSPFSLFPVACVCFFFRQGVWSEIGLAQDQRLGLMDRVSSGVFREAQNLLEKVCCLAVARAVGTKFGSVFVFVWTWVCWVSCRFSMRVSTRAKGLKSCREKNEGAYRSGEGEKSLLGDPGSELHVAREKKKENCDVNVYRRDGLKVNEKVIIMCTCVVLFVFVFFFIIFTVLLLL